MFITLGAQVVVMMFNYRIRLPFLLASIEPQARNTDSRAIPHQIQVLEHTVKERELTLKEREHTIKEREHTIKELQLQIRQLESDQVMMITQCS